MIFGVDTDLFLGLLFLVMVGLFAFMLAIVLPRGRRMAQTNRQIAENQALGIALQERQTAALERIATALEAK